MKTRLRFICLLIFIVIPSSYLAQEYQNTIFFVQRYQSSPSFYYAWQEITDIRVERNESKIRWRELEIIDSGSGDPRFTMECQVSDSAQNRYVRYFSDGSEDPENLSSRPVQNPQNSALFLEDDVLEVLAEYQLLVEEVAEAGCGPSDRECTLVNDQIEFAEVGTWFTDYYYITGNVTYVGIDPNYTWRPHYDLMFSNSLTNTTRTNHISLTFGTILQAAHTIQLVGMNTPFYIPVEYQLTVPDAQPDHLVSQLIYNTPLPMEDMIDHISDWLRALGWSSSTLTGEDRSRQIWIDLNEEHILDLTFRFINGRTIVTAETREYSSDNGVTTTGAVIPMGNGTMNGSFRTMLQLKQNFINEYTAEGYELQESLSLLVDDYDDVTQSNEFITMLNVETGLGQFLYTRRVDDNNNSQYETFLAKYTAYINC